MIDGFSVGFAMFAFIASLLASAFAAYAWVEVLSFKKSTHSVQWVPMTPDQEAKDKELNRQYHEAEAKQWDELGSLDKRDENV